LFFFFFSEKDLETAHVVCFISDGSCSLARASEDLLHVGGPAFDRNTGWMCNNLKAERPISGTRGSFGRDELWRNHGLASIGGLGLFGSIIPRAHDISGGVCAGRTVNNPVSEAKSDMQYCCNKPVYFTESSQSRHSFDKGTQQRDKERNPVKTTVLWLKPSNHY